MCVSPRQGRQCKDGIVRQCIHDNSVCVVHAKHTFFLKNKLLKSISLEKSYKLRIKLYFFFLCLYEIINV